MIKSYIAYTGEIDDVESAVSGILAQLEPEKNCLKNTAAIVVCYHEFGTSGITAELYKRLNFPVIGTTTTMLATNLGSGQLNLAVMMITSDDVVFSAACSSSLMTEINEPLSKMYQNALAGHDEPVRLLISAAPLLLHHAGDDYINILNDVSGGVPNFGTLAVDDSANFENSYVIFNDRCEKDIFAVIAASGNINPKFSFESISPEKILMNPAIITKSEGNLLKEVNGLPLYNYLETLGLASNGKVREGLNSLPLVLGRADGTPPVSKVLIYVNEDGYGVCGGLMPEGASMRIGAWDKDDVVGTALHAVKNALSTENIGGLFIYSCAGRSFVLGVDISAETDRINELVAVKLPYLFAYSGGEICPICSGAGNINQFHNNTIIVCAF